MTAVVQPPINVVSLVTDHPGRSVQGTVRLGDTVHVVGQVVRVFAEQYTVSIYTHGGGPQPVTVDDDQIVAVEVPNPPAEPEDGTWIVAEHDARHDGRNVFVRRDAEAPHSEGRRWPLRWQDIGTGDFIDWPSVITRGGDPDHRLVPAGTRPRREPAANDTAPAGPREHRSSYRRNDVVQPGPGEAPLPTRP